MTDKKINRNPSSPSLGETEIVRQVGRNLKRLRLNAGLSLNDLSRHLAVSYQQIQKYEGGKNRLPVDKLHRLKDLYGVPYEIFFVEPAADPSAPPQPPEQEIATEMAAIADMRLRIKIRDIVRILAR